MVETTPEKIDCFNRPGTLLYRWAMKRFFVKGRFTEDPDAFEPKGGGISCFCSAHEGMSPQEAKDRAPHPASNKPGILELPAQDAQEVEGVTSIEHTPSHYGDEHVDIFGQFEDISRRHSIQLDLLAHSKIVLEQG